MIERLSTAASMSIPAITTSGKWGASSRKEPTIARARATFASQTSSSDKDVLKKARRS